MINGDNQQALEESRLKVMEKAMANTKVLHQEKRMVYEFLANTIRSVDQMNINEAEKQKYLQELLQKIYTSRSKRVYGMKVEDIRQVAEAALEMQNGQMADGFLKSLTMKELLFYMGQCSRMNQTRIGFAKEMEEKLEWEKQLRIRIRELKEEQQRLEEEERLNSMSEGDKLVHELLTQFQQNPANADLKFRELQEMASPEKEVAALAIKQFWMETENKWTGQLNKKQTEKVNTIKTVLGD